MVENQGNAAFLGGLGLGVVLATAISCLMAKRYLEVLVQEAKRENGFRKPARKRSTSRSTSPTRRSHRQPSPRQPLDHPGPFVESANTLRPAIIHEDRALMHSQSMGHLGNGTTRAQSRSMPRAVSPQATALLRRVETTDDETMNAMQMRDFAGFEKDPSASDTGDAAGSGLHIRTTVDVPKSPKKGLDQSQNYHSLLSGRTQNQEKHSRKPATFAGHSNSASGGFSDRAKVMEDAFKVEEYCRVISPETQLTEEAEEVCLTILECLTFRDKWLYEVRDDLNPAKTQDTTEAAYPSEIRYEDPFVYRPMPKCEVEFEMVDGVYKVVPKGKNSIPELATPGTATEFFSDVQHICKVAARGPVKTFCYQRLMLLEQKYNLHVMMNAEKEFYCQKLAPHRDFYNVRKVDTHVHHSACMHQKHLLRFIKSKLRKEPDEVVIFRDGKYLTLKEVFKSLQLSGYDLNVDTLDMHADKTIFQRFDKFNLKYNPCGQSRLREIFIKQDNLIHGRYLAELTKEVFDDLEASKYQHAEYRISIYGRKEVEWDTLSCWICTNKLASDNVVWLIQIPRLYQVCKESGIMEDFEKMLSNIFKPLFEVTADPATHPQLHMFLMQVVGFDMVDDESRAERRVSKNMPTPKEWNTEVNPPFAYYAYYIYANLFTLNKFREARGLNSFPFRPHAGEAGDIDHLVCSFMLCQSISHGIILRRSPFLQYLYYLARIGLCMSPLSNNSLFLDYHKNPFPVFFARGLHVSLSTDDPLQIHLTKEPLVEEYSIAAQVWKLSSTDLCEIARNGVLQSGFPDACKRHWVSQNFWRMGPEGNDIHRTNVPNLRLQFRHDTHHDEFQLLLHGAANFRIREERAAEAEL